MVWSSNRDQMVQENATLTLTSTGELVLEDSDGNLVWSTNTFTQAFLRRVIHESGNLVLYKTSGGIIWQSFDYPTDTILLGQKLKYPQAPAGLELSYTQLDNQSIHIYSQGGRSTCSCPRDGDTFKPIDVTKPNSGCARRVPLVCSEKSRLKDHHFLELEHVLIFTYFYESSSTPGLVSRDACKTFCLEDCSCKASFFRYAANFSSGYCYLDSNIYYMKTNSPVDEFYNSIAYIKVQSKGKHNKYLVVIICASVGGAITLLILLWAWINKSQNGRQQKEKDEDEDEDDHGNWPAGLPLRYTFQELKNGTNNFSVKLGSRGFGSVYEGVLADGSKIAVKRLDGAGEG
ncbi:G-type lectin S-receptor-like serine/threonine-protein kinase SD2-5 [Cryptomeria japonica]|uniref:G-type lectin S-receptor-like serine/threonine-protein kinase SD2-5 n=1 Tax=Cryptomeria japonica TaxID=3369 RepID=UPI0027DA08F9|nr:G-type lectin S-receptor-like serine/threonine-protein kinase SD2-5 [Cryptomeria japonica]